LAIEVLHDDERRAVRQRANVEHACDVLALDLGRRSRFTREALDQLFDHERFGAEKLQCDALAELHVQRGDDVAHSARTEQLLNFVFAGDDLARQERHLDHVLL
jgi:hypothetical protein